MTKTNRAALIIAAASLCFSATGVLAKGFAASHPRRAEVNRRLENQHDRVQAGLKDGQLTRGEARGIRQDDRSIRHEEHTMAALDGGHLTRADQKSLNQQENDVSKQIYTDRH